MPEVTRVRMDQGAIHALFDSEDGPVGRDLARRAVKVESTAKRLCAVDTGRLRSSVTHSIEHDSKGIVAYVGTDVEYAIFQELGTRYQRGTPFLRPALRAAQ